MISLLYASFKDLRSPSVALLISPRALAKHQRLLERKSMNSLAFDGICVGLDGMVLGFHFSFFCEKGTD